MRRSRLVLAAGLVAVLVAVGLWQLVVRALEVDQYRPGVEREIERLTGLPVSIGALELQLRPLLRFSALDVAIGDAELQAHAPRIDAYPLLRPLLQRRVEIGSIEVSELGLRLPDDAERLGERWRELERRLGEAGGEAPSAFLWSVSQIRAESASLRLGDAEGERARGSAVARDLSGAHPTLDLELELPLPGAAEGSLRAALRIEGQSAEDLRIDFRGALDSPPVPALDFEGRARLVGDELEVAELRGVGEDFEASGSALLRGAGEGSLRLDSLRAGAAPLAAFLEILDLGALALAAPAGAGLDARGLALELASGATPRVLAGELDVRGLEVQLSVDRVTGVELQVAFEPARIRVAGSGRSEVLGEIGVEGQADPGAGRAQGAATLDLGAAAGYLETGPLREWLEPLLRAHGPSRLELRAEALNSDAPRLRVVEGTQPPRLQAQLGLRSSEAGVRMGDLEVDSILPAEVLRPVLPASLSARGEGALRLRHDAPGERFSLELDLSAMRLTAGELLDKRGGETLRVVVAGAAPEAGWTANELRLAGDTETLRLDLDGDGLVARDLDLDLAAWSFLLADAWRARGRIAGSFVSRDPRFDLTLSGVGLTRAGDSLVAGLEGRLSGAAQLDGRLAAAEADVDRLLELRALLEALWPPDRDAEVWPRGGQLALRLGRVAAGRSQARRFSGLLGFGAAHLELRDIALETYEGKVSGSLAWLGRKEPQPRLDQRLDISGVTGRFLDDLLFDEPRGIRGRFDGQLRFAARYHDEPRATLAGGSGLLTLTGRQGTLGRTGLATKLITALRTTEALRLRLPSLRDEGLVFDELRANFSMEAGVMKVERFELDSPSYALTGTGVLDFPADTSRLAIEVDVIKGLTPFLGRVPVAGDTLKILNLRLSVDGSPYDMKVRVASTKDQILGVSAAGGRVVVNGVRDALELFRKKPSAPQDPQEPGSAPSGPPLQP